MSFTVPFAQPKQRPRFYHGRAYTPRPTADAESAIKAAWRACPDAPGAPLPAFVPVEVHVTVRRRLPKGTPKRVVARRDLQRPDADNYLKLVCDALNGVAWHDDAQVERSGVTKGWRVRKDHDETDVTVSFPVEWDEAWNERTKGSME